MNDRDPMARRLFAAGAGPSDAISALMSSLMKADLNAITIDGEQVSAQPAMSIPRCIALVRSMQKFIDQLCTEFELESEAANGLFGTSKVPLSEPVNQWLDKIRDELTMIYGKTMLEDGRWFCLDNGLDIYNERRGTLDDD